jgi:hypothetical protein
MTQPLHVLQSKQQLLAWMLNCKALEQHEPEHCLAAGCLYAYCPSNDLKVLEWELVRTAEAKLVLGQCCFVTWLEFV